MHILSPEHQKRNTKPPTNEASAVQSSLLPSAQPVHSSTMKLEVSCPLSCTGQSCHDDHQLRKARAIPIGQHLRCHWNQSAEQNSAHAFPHLAEQKQESFTQVPQRTSSNSHKTVLESKRNAEHTQDRTRAVLYLFSRTMYVVRSCSSCLFSCTTSSWSESLGGDMVILVSQACSLTGSTQASWAREPQRRSRLGLGLFSAGGKVTVSDRCSREHVWKWLSLKA